MATPHEEVKLGSRLDEKNKYKAMNYAQSELRAIETLETVCKHLSLYKYKDGVLTLGKPREAPKYSDRFSVYKKTTDLRLRCDHLLEEYDEELTELIMTVSKESLDATGPASIFAGLMTKDKRVPTAAEQDFMSRQAALDSNFHHRVCVDLHSVCKPPQIQTTLERTAPKKPVADPKQEL